MEIKTGQDAPDFTLYNTQKQQVNLSSLRGKQVVLLFFPAAFTGTCTTELCTVRDDFKSYETLNAVVFGISTDMVYSLSKFRAEQNLNFELLSDYNKEVSTSYGALHETFSLGMRGVSKRASFVINEKGKVTFAEIVTTSGTLPDFDGIKQALATKSLKEFFCFFRRILQLQHPLISQ